MLEKVRKRWGRLRRRRHTNILHTLYELEAGRLVDPVDASVIRHLSDDALHRWIGKATNKQSLSLLDRELRRREAWAAPAGRAYWISLASMVIAIGALIVSIMKI